MGETVLRSVRSHQSRELRSSTHTTRVAELDYAAMARETKRRISWPCILCDYNTSTVQWKWLENVQNFSIYTKEGVHSNSFCVLATGVVNGSVHEVAALLGAYSEQEFMEKMTAFYGKDFKHGIYIGDVPNDDGGDEDDADAAAAHLSVRLATFANAGWLKRDDAWCSLDATTFDKQTLSFEKLMTTVKLEDVLRMGRERRARFGGARAVRDVVCGFNVTPNEHPLGSSFFGDSKRAGGPSVRLHFYAEVGSSHAFGRFVQPEGKHDAPIRAIKKRLLRIAKNCDRLSVLVRRRRLGVQVLVDKRRLLLSANAKCVNCERTQMLAKLCKVCGHHVCGECSSKYERETRVPAHERSSKTVRVDMVRVCDPCLDRIENVDYSNVTDTTLQGPVVVPNPINESGTARSATDDLKKLLHDALLKAPSAQRKDAVVSVIKCVLDQERSVSTRQRPKSSSSIATTATDSSRSGDYIAMIDDIEVPTIPYSEADVAGRDGRVYSLNPHEENTFPIPANEAERLRVIEDLGLLTDNKCDELDIICDLAAKEMGAMASIVSVITKDQQRVIGANNPAFRTMHMQREQSICTHTIMDTKPLILPHPEADYRVGHIAKKSELGIRYYCGFPLFADDHTVIGSLCCVDQQYHEMTEAQYNAMQRLAETAAKVVHIEGAKRKCTLVDESPPEATAM